MNKSIIEELIGSHEGWDILDVFTFAFYTCEKFEGRDVNIDFDKGILEVISKVGVPDEDGFIPSKVDETYDLKIILQKHEQA